MITVNPAWAACDPTHPLDTSRFMELETCASPNTPGSLSYTSAGRIDGNYPSTANVGTTIEEPGTVGAKFKVVQLLSQAPAGTTPVQYVTTTPCEPVISNQPQFMRLEPCPGVYVPGPNQPQITRFGRINGNTPTPNDVNTYITLPQQANSKFRVVQLLGPAQPGSVTSVALDYMGGAANPLPPCPQLQQDCCSMPSMCNTSETCTSLPGAANCQCVPTIMPPPNVYGCMDPNALNYNPNATSDDGSCDYQTPTPRPGGDLPRRGREILRRKGRGLSDVRMNKYKDLEG